MSDSFITILLVMIAAIMVFVVPMVSIAQKNDITSEQQIQTLVTEFVDNTRMTAMIKRADYDKLVEEIEAIGGNTYSINISLNYIDENPAKKTSGSIGDKLKIGENLYYIVYTKQIEDAFEESEDGTIRLTEGSYVKVDAENTSQTMFQTFSKILYGISDGNIGTISGAHAALVISTSEGKQPIAIYEDSDTTEYTITYDANGGRNDTLPFQSSNYKQTKRRGTDTKLSSVKPKHTSEEYKFLGWAEDPSATRPQYLSGATYSKDQDITLYAVWSLRTFKVTYLANLPGGEYSTDLPYEDTNLQAGVAYTIWNKSALPATTSGKYQLIGWNTRADGTGITYRPTGDVINVNTDITLYGMWDLKTYAITYHKNSEEGEVTNMPFPDLVYKSFGEEYTLSGSTPQQEEATFKYWATNPDGTGDQYIPGQVYTGNASLDLYAIWDYELTYNPNINILIAGINSSSESLRQYLEDKEGIKADTIEIAAGEQDKLIKQVESKGYDLLILNCSGWQLSTIGSNAVNKVKQWSEFMNILTIGNDERYVPFISNVTSISNARSTIQPTTQGNSIVGVTTSETFGDSSLASVTFSSDTTVLYKQTIQYGTGYSQSVQSDGIGFYTSNGYNWVHSQVSIMGQSELVYRLAITAVNGLEVTSKLYSNMPDPLTEHHEHNETFNLSSNVPTTQGYTFHGWSTDPSGTVEYSEGQEFTMPAHGVELYAVWDINSYTLTYDLKGGSNGPAAETRKYRETRALSAIKPTKDGFTFKGWSTSSSALTVTHNSEALFSMPSKNVTLYAVWSTNNYTLTYNLKGGSNGPAAETRAYGSTSALSTTTPTKTGNTFKGWSTDSAATTVTHAPGANYGPMPANDVTLYAVWQATNYTLTYDCKGGSNGPAQEIRAYGSTSALSTTTPSKAGHTFKGWSTNSAATTVTHAPGANYGPMPASNVTLYAVWEAGTYTITFNANGGTGGPTSQTKTHGVALTLSSSKPTRSGYTFQGWATSSSATTASYQPGGSYTTEGDATLYAVWKTNVTSVTITSGNKWIANNGSTVTLSATTEPSGGTVTWSSGSTSVATVDSSGKVTAKAAGRATITATVGDKSDSVYVYVYNAVLGGGYQHNTYDSAGGSNTGTIKASSGGAKMVLKKHSTTDFEMLYYTNATYVWGSGKFLSIGSSDKTNYWTNYGAW